MNIDFDDQLNWKKIKCVGNNSDIRQCNVQKKVALAYNIFLLLSILQVHVRAHFLVLNQANYEEKKKKKSLGKHNGWR